MKRETLIQAAAQAYTRQPLLDGYTATPVFRGQSQAFVFANDKEIIIAFRGTEGGNPLDWWTDLKFRKRSIPDIPGKWHRGFVTATHQLTLQLLSRVHFTGASRRVYITGHSMGRHRAVREPKVRQQGSRRLAQPEVQGHPSSVDCRRG
jgi:hypothetical protein